MPGSSLALTFGRSYIKVMESITSKCILFFFWSACYFFDVLVNGNNLIHIIMNWFQRNVYHLDLFVGGGSCLAPTLKWNISSTVSNCSILFTIAANLLCSLCALANDTGWPTAGKPITGLKPPERRDSGTDPQGKSSPSGSPVTPSSEKVSLMALVLGVFVFWTCFCFLIDGFYWLFTGARFQIGCVLSSHIQASTTALRLPPHFHELRQLPGTPQGCSSTSEAAPKPTSFCLATCPTLHRLVLPANTATNLSATEPHLPT